MRIIVEFRKPSKRLLWNLKRLDRWLDKHLPPFLSALSGILLAGGFIVMMGVVGSVEYGDPITRTTIRLLIGSVASMVIGGVMLGCLGDGDDYEKG